MNETNSTGRGAQGKTVVYLVVDAGVAAWGLLLTPAVGAGLKSASMVIVAVNARLLGRVGAGKRSAGSAVEPAVGTRAIDSRIRRDK